MFKLVILLRVLRRKILFSRDWIIQWVDLQKYVVILFWTVNRAGLQLENIRQKCF